MEELACGEVEPCTCYGVPNVWECSYIGWKVYATNTVPFVPQTVEVKVACVAG